MLTLYHDQRPIQTGKQHHLDHLTLEQFEALGKVDIVVRNEGNINIYVTDLSLPLFFTTNV